VLVHPPGGVVGGDTLRIDAHLAPGSHALITTPGATRFYRTAGELAEQSLTARIDDGARLEWLPLETIVHRSALAHNHMRFELAPTAEMIGWDLLALGLRHPAAHRTPRRPARHRPRARQRTPPERHRRPHRRAPAGDRAARAGAARGARHGLAQERVGRLAPRGLGPGAVRAAHLGPLSGSTSPRLRFSAQNWPVFAR
jgi:hypothetical protein